MENGGSIPPVDVTLANKVSTASFLMFLAIQENSKQILGGKHMANVTQFNRSNAGEAILLDIQGLQDALQCGRGTALRIAKEADAEIRIGRRCLYKRKKIEEFIENVKEL